MNTPIKEILSEILNMLLNSFIEAKGYIYILVVIGVAIVLGLIFRKR